MLKLLAKSGIFESPFDRECNKMDQKSCKIFCTICQLDLATGEASRFNHSSNNRIPVYAIRLNSSTKLDLYCETSGLVENFETVGKGKGIGIDRC